MLFGHEQESLVRRKFHARDLLHVVRDHDEVHLADIGLVCVVVDVSNRNVVTYRKLAVAELII